MHRHLICRRRRPISTPSLIQKVIERKKKALSWFEEKDVWTMVRQILSGLSILHERNIIHRDMKSANIFIADNVYKIADLNVSKLMKKDLAYTQTGTPYYASPEVWQDKPYEVKSDIWSFGTYGDIQAASFTSSAR